MEPVIKNTNELAMEFFDNLNKNQILTSPKNYDSNYLEFSKIWKCQIPENLKKNIIGMVNSNNNLESLFLSLSYQIQKEIEKENRKRIERE
jgi:hypothetical protein